MLLSLVPVFAKFFSKHRILVDFNAFTCAHTKLTTKNQINMLCMVQTNFVAAATWFTITCVTSQSAALLQTYYFN